MRIWPKNVSINSLSCKEIYKNINLLLQINEVNLELQKSNSIKINLAYIRDLFLWPYRTLSFSCKSSSKRRSCCSFESGIVMIQNQKENRLTESEKKGMWKVFTPCSDWTWFEWRFRRCSESRSFFCRTNSIRPWRTGK